MGKRGVLLAVLPAALLLAAGPVRAGNVDASLLERLCSPNEATRVLAARALGQSEIRSPVVFRALLSRLDDESMRVRIEAVAALPKVGGETAVPVLIALFEAAPVQVCEAAVEALGRLGELARPELLRTLEESEDPDVRTFCEFALGWEERWDASTQPHEVPVFPVLADYPPATVDRSLWSEGAELLLQAEHPDPELRRHLVRCAMLGDAADSSRRMAECLRPPLRRRTILPGPARSGPASRPSPLPRPLRDVLRWLARNLFSPRPCVWVVPVRARPELRSLQLSLPRLVERLDSPGDWHHVHVLARELSEIEGAEGLVVPRLATLAGRRDPAIAGLWSAARKSAVEGLGLIARRGLEGVSALRGLLASDLEDVAAYAAVALGRLGPAAAAAVPDLRPLIARPSPLVAEAARHALRRVAGDVSSERPVGELVEDVVRGNAGTRWLAMEALRRLRRDAAEAEPRLRATLERLGNRRTEALALFLVTGDAEPALALAHHWLSLKDVDLDFRAACLISELGRAAGPALPSLLALLREDPETARVAALALGRIGIAREDVVAALRAAAGRKEGDVPRTARASLWRLGDREPTLGRLRERLGKAAGRREALREALGLGEGAAPLLPELLACLDEGEHLPLAADCLARIGAPAVPALVERLGAEDADLRLAAAWALLRIGPAAESAVDGLLRASEDESAEVRAEATYALAKAAPEDPRVLEAVVARLADEAFEVRATAARALALLGEAGVPALERARHDPVEFVRTCADLALRRIRGD
jgi:HEAT repeat protein